MLENRVYFSTLTMNDSFHLELLPNEIFLEIFKYFSLHELYRDFYNLNQRINNILRSITQLSLTLDKSDDIHHEAVTFFASHIVHLVVKHSDEINFNQFPSLHSLTSMFPRDDQLRSIRTKHMPNLTHLTLGFMAIWDEEIMMRLCRRIFSNKFPKLRFCSLWPPAFDIDQLTTQTPSLTRVQLQEGTFDDLCVVFDACPNLKYLQMLVSKFAKTPKMPVQNVSVHRLDVSFIRRDLNWAEKLDQILTMVPNIQRLSIEICVIKINFDLLARILKQRLNKLCHLECEIHAIQLSIKSNVIQRQHPLFKQIHLQDIIDDDDCPCGGLKLLLNGKK